MKKIFYLSLIVVIVSLMVFIMEDANAGSPVSGQLGQHDTDIKAEIGTLTTQHDELSTDLAQHNTDVNIKLGQILETVQNIALDNPGAPVSETGQTSTVPLNPAPTGSDGNLQKGVDWPNPRFTDNGDDTITDELTHLIWDKHANRYGQRSWANALTVCSQMADNGGDLQDGSIVGDWRLPNRFELESILHMGYQSPALPNTSGADQLMEGDPFSNVQSTIYWTSTTSAINSGLAWIVNLSDGSVSVKKKVDGVPVWCVRDRQ